MFEQLIQKSYNLDLNGKKISYKQLSYYECLEYLVYSQDKNFNTQSWLENLFQVDGINWKGIDMEKTMKVMYDTAFKWFFWGIPKEKTAYQQIKEKYEFLSLLIARCEKWSIDPIKLLKTYTPEQINLLTEWLIYHINEADKKWQAKNKMIIEKESTPLAEKESILKMSRDIENKLPKKWQLIKSE